VLWEFGLFGVERMPYTNGKSNMKRYALNASEIFGYLANGSIEPFVL
jgi:hypothetical protein